MRIPEFNGKVHKGPKGFIGFYSAVQSILDKSSGPHLGRSFLHEEEGKGDLLFVCVVNFLVDHEVNLY